MKRRGYAPAVLAVGLLSAQLVATFHVYFSNLHLLQTIGTITRHGYLAVPNEKVAEHLDAWSTAMAGGLFFTVSIGTGLSLATLIVIWCWDRFFRRSRTATILCGILWAAGLFLVNHNGWNFPATAYLVVVPLATGTGALVLLPEKKTPRPPLGVLLPVSTAVILALTWSVVLDKDLFTNIRDHLLLSNPIGESITNAYYAYTLYPAEAFKSLHQKQIRTCRLSEASDRNQWNRVEKIVRMRDYLPVSAGSQVDVTIEQNLKKSQFLFQHRGKTVLQLSERDFFLDPGKALKSFSREQDRNAMFRTITLAGLLLGFPLVLLTMLFSLISALANFFFPASLSEIVAALLCTSVGILLLIPVYQGQQAMVSQDYTIKNLGAASPAKRIATLKKACANRQDLSHAARKYGISQSTNIAERYWLTRNLVFSENHRVSDELLALANDPALIVACQAMWALEKRNDRSVVPEIIERITTSPHWYLQLYAYRTVKALGWVQPRSQQHF